MHDPKKQKDKGSQLLWRYAGLGSELIVSLGLGVLAGYYADKWLRLSFPLWVWLLPLIILIVLFIKIFKDTSRKNGNGD